MVQVHKIGLEQIFWEKGPLKISSDQNDKVPTQNVKTG